MKNPVISNNYKKIAEVMLIFYVSRESAFGEYFIVLT